MVLVQLLHNLSYYIYPKDNHINDSISSESTPRSRINLNDETIENNRIISEINQQINIAKKNIEHDLGTINKYDKEIIIELKSALTETFTNSTYMLQKIIKKNKLFSDDYYDIIEQKNNLEQLNNIFESIQSKYY
jgi:hypothetical protein